MKRGKIDKHPSYGMLKFSRMSGGTTNLFGSSIKHRDTIRMCLYEGSVERMLSSDFYMDDGAIAEVEMSYSQFAEAITSMNVGSGVPVTIRYLKGVGNIEPCPFIDKRKQFENEFKNNLDSVNKMSKDLISEVSELFETKKSLTKADKETILKKLDAIQRFIGSNSSFVYEQFNEQMDKTTTEAKGEIEAFMQNKLNSIAQAALVEQREQLISMENPICLEDEENKND